MMLIQKREVLAYAIARIADLLLNTRAIVCKVAIGSLLPSTIRRSYAGTCTVRPR